MKEESKVTSVFHICFVSGANTSDKRVEDDELHWMGKRMNEMSVILHVRSL